MWVDDLSWHRRMYRQSRYRWFSEDPISIVTAHTGGQLDFTTTSDVERLQATVLAVGDDAVVVSNALARKLEQALPIMIELDDVADLIGMSYVECSAAIWLYQHSDKKADSLNISRVLDFVPFRNPLIEAWELKQLLRLYEAAQSIAEVALCDLVNELTGRDPEHLARLAGCASATALRRRVETALDQHGPPGDPRRVRHQIF